MEPTIYKPSIYKGAGIYKTGAGGGGGGGDLIYESDFTNFDTSTGVDIPIVGGPKTYTKQNIEKTTRTIAGVTLNCIRLKRNAIFSTILEEISDYDTLSVEYTTNKDSFNGLGCGCELRVDDQIPISQFYNCYQNTFGIGVYNFSTTEPGFYSDFAITSDNIDRTNVTRIITGGITADKTTNKLKAFVVGKKAATLSCSFTKPNPIIWCYTDDVSNTEMNLYRIRVYRNRDLFEEME